MIVYTFYSYKGGVGRSMALANIAEWYYRQGLRAVIMDWDLEAPGLEKFFLADEKQIEGIRLQLGIIDILAAYKRLFPSVPLSKSSVPESAPVPADASSTDYSRDLAILDEHLPPLSHSLIQIRGSAPITEKEPGLWLLSAGWRAGDRFPIYAEAVQSFNWSDFYNSYRGDLYFEWMRHNLASYADVVLIDSRTGVTEMGGVCTRQLADVVVSLTAPNDQNLEGVTRMASSFVREIPTRRRPAPQMVFVPARVDTSEKDRRNKFEAEFREKLDGFIPVAFRNARTDFWRMRIPYISAYAYEEALAIAAPDRDKDLEESYKVLAAHLAMMAPGKSALRKKFAAEIERIFGKLLPTVFISCRGEDGRNVANAIESRLNEYDISVWPVRSSNEATTVLDQTKHMLFVLTPDSMQSNEMRSEYLYARRQGVDVLLVYTDVKVNPAATPAMPGAWFGFDSNAIPVYLRGQQVYETGRDWDALIRVLQSPPKNVRVPFMAPDVPARFADRPVEVGHLQNEILNSSTLGSNFALWAPGGSGKSTVATALCHDDDIIAAFEGGILWTTLGTQPEIRAEIIKLIVALTGERSLPFVDEADAGAYLADKLGQRRCLLVIDDVWESRHVQSFLRGGPNCVRLITTRDSSLATSIGARLLTLGELSEEESFNILTAQIQVSQADNDLIGELVKALGRIPLVLKLANAQLKERIDRGMPLRTAAEQLMSAIPLGSLLAFDQPNSLRRDESVATTVSISLDYLGPEEREKYLTLSYYGRGHEISISDAVRLWHISQFDAERKLQSWHSASLLLQGSAAGQFVVPQILWAFVERNARTHVNARYEAEFARFTAEEQSAARDIFIKLAASGPGQPASFADFDPKQQTLIRRLLEAGMLMKDDVDEAARDDGNFSVRLADSAVATEWKKLREWLEKRPAPQGQMPVTSGNSAYERLSVPAPRPESKPSGNPKPMRKRYAALAAVVAVMAILMTALLLYFNQNEGPLDPPPTLNSGKTVTLPDATLAESLIDSGKLDYQKGEYVVAVSKFTSAINLIPKSAAAYLNRGIAQTYLGKYDAAISDYTNVLSLGNDSTGQDDAYYLRGAAHQQAKKYTEAIADYTQAIKRKPDFVTAYIRRGETYLALGNRNNAVADFQAALKLTSDKTSQAEIRKQLQLAGARTTGGSTPVERRPEIVLHYSVDDGTIANQLEAYLNKGNNVRSSEEKDLQYNSVIRYFHKDDARSADALADNLNSYLLKMGIKVRLTPELVDAAGARGTIDIWLPPR